MFRASWNGAVLAESEQTIRIEGNHYFPPEAVNRHYFRDSATTSRCPWKGQARYYDIVVEGATNPAAAWYYANPSAAARKIAGHVAFWHGARIERVDDPGAAGGLLLRLRALIAR